MSAQPRPRNLLRRLPLEIRLKIYPHALAMGWNYKLPNLLAALAEEPDLFEEATRVYLETNANIDCRNLIAYNSLLKKNEALKLEHLMIGCILTPSGDCQFLAGSLIKLMNNLSTISLDLTTCCKGGIGDHYGAGTLYKITEVDNASSCLTRVAIRIPSVEMMNPRYTDAQKERARVERRQLIEYINRRYGVKGRLEQIPDEVQCPDTWFWETMDNRRGRLKITPGWH